MANGNKEIKIGILNDPNSFKVLGAKSKGAKEFYQGADVKVDEDKKPILRSKPGYVINGNNHPITLSYNGEAMVLAPKAKEIIANSDLLGGLAKGVFFVPDAKLKN